MPPPPVTPSPHRFVIKKPAPIRETPLAHEATPRPSTQQFKATPRFNVSSTPRPTPSQTLPPPPSSATRFATPARQRQDDVDIIESSSLEGPVQESIERDNDDLEATYLSAHDGYDIEERDTKRRRLSSSVERSDEKPGEPASSLPSLPSPPTARRPLSTAASRFLSTPHPTSTPLPNSTYKDREQPFLKPPRFRPPDSSEATQTDPLPEQFSPHRRGQKYMPGGLAAEVRDWLVNLESTPAPKTDDGWRVRVLVDEVKGGGRTGMTMIRGRQVHGDGLVDGVGEVKVVLAGEGTGTGLQRAGAVEVGRMVGIKGPVWEIMLEESRWGVGVEWTILS